MSAVEILGFLIPATMPLLQNARRRTSRSTVVKVLFRLETGEDGRFSKGTGPGFGSTLRDLLEDGCGAQGSKVSAWDEPGAAMRRSRAFVR